MSQIPSNSQQFLMGVQTGVQNAGQATQNFAVAEQARVAQQQLALEQQRMMQQGQQFERGLQAEQENYRRLNESRERMQQAEMSQQGAQFQQRMAFDAEQARVERTLAMRLKQHEMEMMALDREIAATASNDPRIVELRAKRRNLKGQGRNLEMMMGAAGQAQQLAQGVREDRLTEAASRLTAMQEGLQTRASAAADAVQKGFQYASLVSTGDSSFINQLQRLSAQGGIQRPGEQAEGSPISSSMSILYDNFTRWAFGEAAGDEYLARQRATEFMANGAAMAAQTLDNAIRLNKGSFGLKDGEREKAAALVSNIVADASILTNIDPQVAAGGSEAQNFRRQRIAQNIGELRKTGMGDEQISALFDGLDSISENRANLLAEYAGGDASSPEAKILTQSLDGVGRISDFVQGVAGDQTLMGSVGGVMKDPSKYDWIGTLRRAQASYGMGAQSQQIAQLQQAISGYGIPESEVRGLIETLTASDPNLQYLRPEDYTNMIRGMQMEGYTIQDLMEALGEDIGQTQAEVMAGRQGQMFRQGATNFGSILDELAR